MMNKRTVLLALGLVMTASLSAQTPESIEYFLDTDPGYGMGRVIANISVGDNDCSFDLSSAKEGAHILYIRVQDSEGRWSPTMARPLFIERQHVIIYDPSRIEYFFDTDPGYGLGRQLENPHTGANTYIMDFSGLEAGAHVLYLRAEDTKSNWSATLARPFFVMNPAPSSITAIEYYIDADPGNGFGIPVPLPSSFENDIAFEVQTNEISVGNHQFSVRICDETGKWSVVKSQPFQVVTEDGVLSVKWLMNVAVQAKEGTVVLTDASSSRNEDCVVELFSLSGQSLGAHDWPLDQNHLTIPVAAHHRMLVVKVTERKSQLQVVQRLMMQ